MMSLTFGLFTQVSGSGPLGPLVYREGSVGQYPIFPEVFRSSDREVIGLGSLERTFKVRKVREFEY